MHWSRRRFLASAGLAGSVALAGCPAPRRGFTPGDGDTTPTPDPVPAEYDLSVDHDLDSWDAFDPDWSPPTDTPPVEGLGVETVIEDLEVPWDLSFAPDGDLFISERVGRIARYDSESLTQLATPDVLDRADAIAPGEEGGWWAGGSEGGLMGIAIHPGYPDVPILYAIYTQETHGGFRNRLVYYDVSAADPTDTETVVIDDIPGHEIIHNGARLAFGPAKYLWVTTGDADERDLAADPGSLAGSVLRLEPDGTAPDDNPFAGDDSDDSATSAETPTGDPRVYAYGHRNPQGISFLPDGTPIVSEHGPSARDEVIIPRAGAHHGWGPEDVAGRDAETYEGTDYARPVVNTGPAETWAPSGCVFCVDSTDGSRTAPEGMTNRLLVGGLISERVHVVTVGPSDGPDLPGSGGERFDADWLDPEYAAVAHRALEGAIGRVRHVEQGPNGELYAITSNRDGRASDAFPTAGDDRLVRLTL